MDWHMNETDSGSLARSVPGRRPPAVSLAIGGLFAAAFTLSLWPGQGWALTLEEAVQIALDTHPTVQAAVANKRSREEAVDEVRAPFFPVVDARSGSGSERSNTPGTRGRASRIAGDPASSRAAVDMLHTDSQLSIRQMVFDGFETRNRTQSARIRTRAAGFQLRDTEELIALRAAEAYHTVLREREIVDLAQENVEIHLEVLEDVRLRVREGAGSIADVRQAEARTALASTRLNDARGDLRDAETDFIEAVGAAPDDLELPEPPEENVPASLEDSVEEALTNSPAVTGATVTVEARRSDVEASKGVMLPRLDIELAAQRNQNIGGSRGLEQIYQAFAVVRWNLFRGGGDKARTRRLMETASQAIHLEAETRRLIEEQIRIDFNRRQTSMDRLPTLEDRVLAADQVVAAYRQQFQLGQRTLLDVLDVDNELFQARVSLVTGEFDFRVSNYQILATIGVLGPSLGVARGMGEGMDEGMAEGEKK